MTETDFLFPGKERLRKIRQRYGLTADEYKKKIVESGFSCGFCDKRFKDRFDMCTDHCHRCGQFRTLLCRRCNTDVDRIYEIHHLLVSGCYCPHCKYVKSDYCQCYN